MGTKFVALILFFAGTQCAWSGTETGNGGDAFVVRPGEMRVFDAIEYEEPFLPVETDAFKQVIAPQLERIEKQLPLVAEYMRFVFKEGAMWFWVRATLKDAPTTGGTQLSLFHDKIQAAVTTRGVTQINLDVWKVLSPMSQAFLLMHEMLWTAEVDPAMPGYLGEGLVHIYYVNGHKVVKDSEYYYFEQKSSNIRMLTGIFMNTHIAQFSFERLRQLLHGRLAWSEQKYNSIYGFRKPKFAEMIPVKSKRDGFHDFLISGSEFTHSVLSVLVEVERRRRVKQ